MSLITPLAAQASGTYNIVDIKSYSRSKTTAKRFDHKTFLNEGNAPIKTSVEDVESYQNFIEAGTFSDTTLRDGKAIFSLGQAETDDNALLGRIQSSYTYTMNLNSSFSGDDNLYIRIKSGNHTGYSVSKTEMLL